MAETFEPKEARDALLVAFEAASNQEGHVVNEARLAYLRGYATQLLGRVEALEVDSGHLSWTELVTLLTGAALAAQVLHVVRRAEKGGSESTG